MFDRRKAACLIRSMWVETLIMLLALGAFILAVTLPFTLALAEDISLTREEAALWNAYQSDEIIRLHILADSDHPEAQQIKLHVRDALIEAFGSQLAQASQESCEAVYSMLMENTSQMCTVARECALQYGFQGEVTAQVGRLQLPAKTYGHVTLPAGEYRALRITLGKGEGQNWWCVLFPQLCLAVSGEPHGETTPGSQQIQWQAERIFAHWLALGC